MSDATSFKRDSYEHNEMCKNPPDGFTPDRVMHRVVSMNSEFEFVYKEPLKAYRWPQRAFPTIEDMITHIATKGAKGIEDDIDADAPLAIPIWGHAYVLIELDNALPWRFDPEFVGVSLGVRKTDADKKHRDARHYNAANADGAKLQHEGCADCRFVVFSTLLPTEDSPQAINYNLIDSNGTKFTIDPDIRYPGTGGGIDEGPG